MPRSVRKISENGIYHVMLRGINRQQIFADSEDYKKFLDCLREYQKKCEFRLYAYCLMPNHIHLLMKPEKEPLGMIFRRLGASFVYWYNGKYGRSGHLFQDRYKSELVTTEAYFVTVIRYIHQNPVKGGLCDTPADYPYSSYSGYFCEGSMIDSEPILSAMDRETFRQINLAPTQESCMDVSDTFRKRLTDEQLLTKMRKISGCGNASEFQTLPTEKRDKSLRSLLKQGGSIRQVSRITGISVGIVRNYTRG